jgi:hypothetical protein
MTIPGFNAETSLYKTSVHYRLTGASVQADGVTPSQVSFPIRPFGSCGPCYRDISGNCSRDCGGCILFPTVSCYHWTEPCNPSACPPPCCPPGYHCCGECLPGRCVPDPFSGQGCVPPGVRCR